MPKRDKIEINHSRLLDNVSQAAELVHKVKNIDRKIEKLNMYLTLLLNQNDDKKKSASIVVVFNDRTIREKNKEKKEASKYIESPDELLLKELEPPTPENPKIDEDGFEIYEEEDNDFPQGFPASIFFNALPFPFIMTKKIIKKDSNIDYAEVDLHEDDSIEIILFILNKLKKRKENLIETIKKLYNKESVLQREKSLNGRSD